MPQFNKNSPLSNANLAALLLSGSLLTGCNQQTGYRMDPADQATASSIANQNKA